MPRKKKATTTTKAAKTTRTTRTRKVATPKKQSPIAGFFESLGLGESYSSLVLGIIAVIVATLVLLSFVHNSQEKAVSPEVTPTIAQSNSFAITQAPMKKKPSVSTTPSQAMQAPQKFENPQTGTTYTVAAGDNLWMIAEKVYKDGYKWVVIAKANNLSDPDDIHVGNKLVIPQVKQDVPTVQTPDEHLSRSEQTKIVEGSYKVVPGDNLWGIALRSYGDGYQWTKIAQANHLSNPNIIHTGNVLKIPRT